MRKIIVSVHDVSPVSIRETEIIISKLNVKKSSLYTPLWYGSKGVSKELTEMIKREDVVLHGLTHHSERLDIPATLTFMKKGLSREFLHLNEEESEARIEKGIALLEASFDRVPRGFIPPMWYHNPHMLPLLKQKGFSYTESWLSFIDLKNQINHRSLPLSFDYGNDNILSRLLLFSWRPVIKNFDQKLIRLAIHPSDVRNGFLPAICELVTIAMDKGYIFCTCEEVCSNSTP